MQLFDLIYNLPFLMEAEPDCQSALLQMLNENATQSKIASIVVRGEFESYSGLHRIIATATSPLREMQSYTGLYRAQQRALLPAQLMSLDKTILFVANEPTSEVHGIALVPLRIWAEITQEDQTLSILRLPGK